MLSIHYQKIQALSHDMHRHQGVNGDTRHPKESKTAKWWGRITKTHFQGLPSGVKSFRPTHAAVLFVRVRTQGFVLTCTEENRADETHFFCSSVELPPNRKKRKRSEHRDYYYHPMLRLMVHIRMFSFIYLFIYLFLFLRYVSVLWVKTLKVFSD